MAHSSLQRILALNEYARDGDYLHEGWATTVFKRTYQVALKACSDLVGHTLGVQVSWCPEDPGHLTVYRTSLATDRTEVLRRLPLEGELAQALEFELQQMAVVRAEDALRQEREQALHRAAVARVQHLLKHADSGLPATA